MATKSDARSIKLRKELDACYSLGASQLDQRERCFEEFLTRHQGELNSAERFEIQNTIATLKETRERTAGNVEGTIEHAGKLLGARIHPEEEGVRIDGLLQGPLPQAQVREQGLVVLINGQPAASLAPAELVARLEDCQDKPITLVVRYIGKTDVTFDRVEARCGAAALGKRLTQVVLPFESCTSAESPEVRLGLGWCYWSEDGILEIKRVCGDSPAAAAGVQPGQQIVTINGDPVLGMSPFQLSQLVQAYPKARLLFESNTGTLTSPSPLAANPLPPDQATRCWQAIQEALRKEEAPEKP
jgi:C-terminal processing protease CtpA/Prc